MIFLQPQELLFLQMEAVTGSFENKFLKGARNCHTLESMLEL